MHALSTQCAAIDYNLNITMTSQMSVVVSIGGSRIFLEGVTVGTRASEH